MRTPTNPSGSTAARLSVIPTKQPRKETRRPSIFWLMAPIGITGMRLMTRQVVHHPERIPAQGAFVLAPNHYSEIDPIAVGKMLFQCGRLPRFLAKSNLFRVPVLGWVLRRSGQVPVYRATDKLPDGGIVTSPFQGAKKIVDAQAAVIVYPEGSLTRDPELWPMRGKTGAALIALEQSIPVIPLAHWGTQNLLPRYGKKIHVWPRSTITFDVGEPVDLSAYRGKPIDAKILAAATDDIMAAITGLLEGLRGEKAPAERWDPAQEGQNETGHFDEKTA